MDWLSVEEGTAAPPATSSSNNSSLPVGFPKNVSMVVFAGKSFNQRSLPEQFSLEREEQRRARPEQSSRTDTLRCWTASFGLGTPPPTTCKERSRIVQHAKRYHNILHELTYCTNLKDLILLYKTSSCSRPPFFYYYHLSHINIEKPLCCHHVVSIVIIVIHQEEKNVILTWSTGNA